MASRLAVTLLGKPGCHLCEAAAALLAEIGRHIPLEVTEVNIETDDTLLARYMFEIPVIVVDGEELARAPIDGRALERSLRSMFSNQR